MTFDPEIGRCRCGRVEIEISAPPFMTAACHCRGCQRMSSSAFSLSAIVAEPHFRLRQGVPVKGGLKGPQLDHYFCPDCMTWMFTRITGMEGMVNVRPTMFDTLRWCEPFIETMTSERLPWVTTPARHRFEAFPRPEDFPKLIAEFAAERL